MRPNGLESGLMWLRSKVNVDGIGEGWIDRQWMMASQKSLAVGSNLSAGHTGKHRAYEFRSEYHNLLVYLFRRS